MDDQNYMMGVIKTQVEDLIRDVEQIRQDLKIIKESNDTMSRKWDTWEARLGGAVVILGFVGSIFLYFSGWIMNFISKKIGL